MRTSGDATRRAREAIRDLIQQVRAIERPFASNADEADARLTHSLPTAWPPPLDRLPTRAVHEWFTDAQEGLGGKRGWGLSGSSQNTDALQNTDDSPRLAPGQRPGLSQSEILNHKS